MNFFAGKFDRRPLVQLILNRITVKLGVRIMADNRGSQNVLLRSCAITCVFEIVWKAKICDRNANCNTTIELNPMAQRSSVWMSHYFVANNMVGFQHNVNNKDSVEQVARGECFHNRNSKDF